jgi:hypothetical protein
MAYDDWTEDEIECCCDEDQAYAGALVECNRCHRAVPEVPDLFWTPDPYAVEFPEDHNPQDLEPRWWCQDCHQSAIWEI